MTNYNAETYCTSRGYHLVEIFNQNQQDFIEQEAKNIGGYFWIGLKRQGASTWKWLHSKKVPQFTSWNSGSPGNGNENRLANLHSGLNYKWIDWGSGNPSSAKFYPLCQFDL